MLDAHPHPRFRTRTRELRPFWQALHAHHHDPADLLVWAADWPGIPAPTVNALHAAGITCSRQVEACPDWLLATIPDLGPVQIQLLRMFVPYRRDVHRAPACPGKQVENQRWVDQNVSPLPERLMNNGMVHG